MSIQSLEIGRSRLGRGVLRNLVVIALAAVCAAAGSAQRLSLGVVGGGYFNRDFDSFYTPAIPGRTGFDLVLPDSGGFIVGPAIELRLSDRFAVEGAALYKPLHYEDAPSFQGGTIMALAPNTVVTWQYPLLLRYRTSSRGLGPFVEGGPSFRSTGNLNRADPSHIGLTAGAGVEVPWGRLRFSPSVRYTRWREDDPGLQVRSRPDQLEFLAGVYYDPGAAARPLGRNIRIGAVVGSTLTKHGETEEFTSTGPGGSFQVFESSPKRQAIVAGPRVEILLSPRASFEANAIPRSFRNVIRVTRHEGDIPIQAPVETTSGGIWEFPILVKYRFVHRSSIRPILEIGPSFRLPKELAGAKISTYGLTAGAGAELSTGPIRIEPAVRFTHWGPDTQASAGGNARTGISRNQAQIIVGLSF